MATILDGKAVSEKLRGEVRAEAEALRAKGVTPGLAVVIVGDNSASKVYVRNKKRACADCGLYSEEYALPADASEGDLLALIQTLNQKPDIHGILCQLPLPAHINEANALAAISPDKDVDAFHPQTVGRFMTGDTVFAPCTPAGVMRLLAEYGIEVAGKRCVVVGRSNIVGKPQALMLLAQNGTVTICHSKTKNLADVTRSAEILVCAIGRAKMITGDMLSDGVVVIDVGMNRDENGKLCGDVDFASASEKASFITPVPGGVGVMTVAMLMQNTLLAAKRLNGLA